METMVIIKLILALLWLVGSKLFVNWFLGGEAKLSATVSELIDMTNKLAQDSKLIGVGSVVELAIYACCIFGVFGSWGNIIIYSMIGCDIFGIICIIVGCRYLRKQDQN